MRIKVKGRKFVTEDIWFENFTDKRKIKSKADRACLHANNVALGTKYALQHSLISDLSLSEDNIFESFSSTVRNEIRRAEREEIKCDMLTSAQLKFSDEIVSVFLNMYKEMYAEKGMERELPPNQIQAYIHEGCFLLSTSYIDEEPIVFHAYVSGDNTARLLYSCSKFRVQDNSMRNAIGRANKLLHWNDMKYLQKQGIEHYDWGGIASIEEPNGIDKFKMSFGGKPVSYYNCIFELSVRAKLFALYRKIFKR